VRWKKIQAVEHKIGFCTNSNGERIAYETFGHGPALVFPPAYFAIVGVCDLGQDYRAFFEDFARFHTVVIYDTRGAGLSDRNRNVYDLESELSDLEAVINHLNLDKVILFGMSMGGPIAIAYAVKHPECVSHLMLYGTYAYYGKFVSNEVRSSLLSLLRQPNNWIGLRSFTSIWAPSSKTDEIELLMANAREITTSESYSSLVEMLYTLDVTDLCPQVKVPTLIVHAKDDKLIDFRAGRELASLIPSAQFVPWTGDHLGNVRDSELRQVVLKFLGDPVISDPVPKESAGYTGKAESLSNPPEPKTEQKKVNWLRMSNPLVKILITILASVIAGIILMLIRFLFT